MGFLLLQCTGENLSFTVVRIDDSEVENPSSWGDTDYESFLETGDIQYNWQMPKDEWQALALNYTSGYFWKTQRGCLSPPRLLFDEFRHGGSLAVTNAPYLFLHSATFSL